MQIEEFTFRARFRSDVVDDEVLEQTIKDVETAWRGCLTSFWEKTDNKEERRIQLENLLVAWQLADLYPTSAVGIVSNAGMTLERKAIGGVDLYFDKLKVQESLQVLCTNPYGIRALQLLTSSPEMYRVYG